MGNAIGCDCGLEGLSGSSQIGKRGSEQLQVAHAKQQEMKSQFGNRGDRLARANEWAFRFICLDVFRQAVDQSFTKLPSSRVVSNVDFQKEVNKMVKTMLKMMDVTACRQFVKASISKSELTEMFEIIDLTGQRKIENKEYSEIALYCCALCKSRSAEHLLSHLTATPECSQYTQDGEPTPFVLGGDCRVVPVGVVGHGFELTSGYGFEEGHVLCTDSCSGTDSKINVRFDYCATQLPSDRSGCGEGLCVYLADLEVEGTSTDFNGNGYCGFEGKPGVLGGLFLDLGGSSGEDNDCVYLKGACEGQEAFGKQDFAGTAGGLATEGAWWRVDVNFDTRQDTVSVKINGQMLISNLTLGQRFTFPAKVCVGISAASGSSTRCKFAVRELQVTIWPVALARA